MDNQIEVTVTVGGIEKRYLASYDKLHGFDWNEVVRASLDDASNLYD